MSDHKSGTPPKILTEELGRTTRMFLAGWVKDESGISVVSLKTFVCVIFSYMVFYLIRNYLFFIFYFFLFFFFFFFGGGGVQKKSSNFLAHLTLKILKNNPI